MVIGLVSLSALGLGALSLGAGPAWAGSGDVLTVASWGGAYQQAQEIAFFKPFTAASGIKVKVQSYDGSLTGVRRLLTQTPPVDVIDVSSATLAALCKDKLVSPLDPSILAPQSETGDGTDASAGTSPPQDDFLPGGIAPCGIASVAWSAPLVYRRKDFKTPPEMISALLDTKDFPGKRALPDSPRYTLELALLADGVLPDDIYTTLDTPEGLNRAFAALDKIKSDIVWWTDPSQPLRWIRNGKASMGLAYTGRIFQMSMKQPGSLGIVWDGQIYDLDFWTIPENSANAALAKRFIAFAEQPDRLAADAALTGYGPMRRSALSVHAAVPVAGVTLNDLLPTTSEHLAHALQFDAQWWQAHGEAIAKRFSTWRAAVTPEETARDANPPKAKL